jgi:hypothetical protein
MERRSSLPIPGRLATLVPLTERDAGCSWNDGSRPGFRPAIERAGEGHRDGAAKRFSRDGSAERPASSSGDPIRLPPVRPDRVTLRSASLPEICFCRASQTPGHRLQQPELRAAADPKRWSGRWCRRFWQARKLKGEAVSREDRVRVFSDFLKEEGYAPKMDDDGDIAFKAEGRSYYVIVEDKDEEYLRILFPNFWRIESPDERLKVERAALKATAETKVAKVFPVRDNTCASIEIFASPIENAKSVFSRCMRALQAAVHTFVEEMRK